MQESLYRKTLYYLYPYLDRGILVGYSGGMDSHVLLDILSKMKNIGLLSSHILAIHVNHKQNKDSDIWEKHCNKICVKYKIPLITEVVTNNIDKGESIESFLRDQRYKLIKKHIKKNWIFLSAHHQRDQAETFLLQLMRGSGIDGLKAMPKIKLFGKGLYIRPLLDGKYSDIVSYAKKEKLEFIEDSSNQDTRFDRNYIRHQVLPVLDKRFPHASQAISTSAKWLSELQLKGAPDKLNVDKLKSLPINEQKYNIRSLFKKKTKVSLSQKQTLYIIKNHLTAADDKNPTLNVGLFIVRRFNNEIIITKKPPKNISTPAFTGSINTKNKIEIDGFAKLCWESSDIGLDDGEYEARAIKGNARFHPHYRKHSTTVKKLFYENNIPPWLRPFFFGIFDQSLLVAIPGVGIAKEFYKRRESAFMPTWIINKNFVKM